MHRTSENTEHYISIINWHFRSRSVSKINSDETNFIKLTNFFPDFS
ncbi:hypothetical protein LCGC14_0530890 [marine sediment metagenome]|uniref:Uncharacterized protein n=1 Tax=marine sediment metagenome TaxID=412755 RepID=A0A0F9UH35_9ZZZZ